MVREGYKQTEVGEIPEDWDVRSFKEMTTEIGDGIHTTPVYSNNGEYHFVNGNNIVNGSVVVFPETKTVSEAESKNHYKPLSDRTVLLSINGTIGNVGYYSGEKVVLGKSAAYLNFKENISKQYAYYSLQTSTTKRQFEDGLTGSTIKNLGLGTIRETRTPIPSCELEQNSIAKALSDVDELIISLEKLIAKKRDIKTATMQQLLTGKKRLPGFGEGKGYKQTELGEIPEDWDVKSYGDIFDFFTTATNSRSDLSDKGSHYYIHYGDIHTEFDYVVDFDNSVIPRIQSEKINSASLLKDGDLLMADASEDYEGIGKSVEVKNLGVEKAVSGLHTFLLRDKDETFVDGYRGYLHTITYVKKSFDRLATGLKVYGLSKNNLKQVLIPIPSKDEQREIVAVLVSMREGIQSLCDRMEKTKAIKQGMMQELLTGRTRLVDVPASEEVEEERMHGT